MWVFDFNSIGGTALSVGSIKVNTINLARIAYDLGIVAHEVSTIAASKTKEAYEQLYYVILRDRVSTALDCLDRVRHIITRNVEKGLLRNYADGLIDIDHQYNTLGIIGVYEVLEKFGYIATDDFGYHSYTDAGLAFAENILRIIHVAIDEWKQKRKVTYNINIEQVPAERAAAVLQDKDKTFYPEEAYTLPLYGNQWIPLGIKCTLQEKARVTAKLDKACSGGAIGHFNIQSPFKTFDDAWRMLNYVASQGCTYFAFNYKISVCRKNHSFFGDVCPYCGGKKHTEVERIVGFLTPHTSWSKQRRAEGNLRTYFDPILN